MATQWILRLVFVALCNASERTWWVDQSCQEKLDLGVVDQMMTQAVETANMIRQRLRVSSNDEEAAFDAFQTIFKFDAANPDTYQTQWDRFTRESMMCRLFARLY